MIDEALKHYKMQHAEKDVAAQGAHIAGSAYVQEILDSLRSGELDAREAYALRAIVQIERRRQ